MYKVYCDGTVIYDLFSPDLMLLDPVLQLEINSPGSFEFTIPLDHPYYDLPQEMLSRVWVTKDDEEIFRGRVIEEEIDWYKRKKVYCEGELAFLNDSIQRPAEYHNLSVRDYFKTLIEEHNTQVEEDKQFEIGYVLVEDSNDSLYRYTNYNSTLTEMKEDLVDDLGGCIRVRNQDGHRYLDYITIEDYGARNDQAIRFGINLLDFSQTMDVSDIATVIIPLGERLEESPIEALDMRLTIESVNSGSDAIESAEAVETYGKITKTVIWDDVTVASNLLEKGKKYLSDYQWDPLVLEVTPVDLHDSDPDTESFNLGDELRVISAPHGLDRYFPLSAMTIHLDSLDQNTFTLGTEIKGKTLTGTVQTAIQQAGDIEKEITPTQILLNQAKEQATNLITAATHGYVVLQPNDSPNEILIMDTDDISTARRVWRWNLNGLGYSSSGYNGTFGTAITMDGAIVADYITTGTLTANLIKAGTISDVPGNNYWDLDNGEFYCKNGMFYGVVSSIGSNREMRLEDCALNLFYNDNRIGTIALYQGSTATNDVMFSITANNSYSKGLRLNSNLWVRTSSNTDWDYDEYIIMHASTRVRSTLRVDSYLYQYSSIYFYGNYIYFYSSSGSRRASFYTTSNYFYISCNNVSGVYINGGLQVTGTKNRIVDTTHYGTIAMNSFETASPMFSDIGSGTVGEDGRVSIYFSPEFIEVIDTVAEYQVFLTRTSQKQTEWVEKKDCYFIVHGEAGATFDWMITAHQKGYATDRFETVTIDEK